MTEPSVCPGNQSGPNHKGKGLLELEKSFAVLCLNGSIARRPPGQPPTTPIDAKWSSLIRSLPEPPDRRLSQAKRRKAMTLVTTTRWFALLQLGFASRLGCLPSCFGQPG